MPRSNSKKHYNEGNQKWREKTLNEHGNDGVVIILKEMSKDDNVNYHVVNDTNECTVKGSKQSLTVDGRCKVGYFKMDGSHFLGRKGEGIEIHYRITGRIVKDSWGQEELSVDDHSLDGLDFMEGKYTA